VSDSYRDLIVWQKAMALARGVYAATDAFPPREMYGLTNQLRRAAVAIPSDIAEGKGRISKKEFVQMLSKARGSCFEVQTQLELSSDLGFLNEEMSTKLNADAAEVGRLLNGLISSIRNDISRIRDGDFAANFDDDGPDV
jgi:four helix bundle protein